LLNYNVLTAVHQLNLYKLIRVVYNTIVSLNIQREKIAMSEYTNQLQRKPTEYQAELNMLDDVTKQWAIMSLYEKDLEAYHELKEKNDSL